ncbi:MAG: TonB-dependent receptor [Ignavibacteriae bacterium]|nr:MAG: TonB-dependent receptor [Ignavibacteriota bacterium]
MKKPTTLFLLMLCLVIACVQGLTAGTAGKIAGHVVDNATHEALIAANITLKGTSLGAATDIDGNYTILNVPPGVYTLNVSVIGYRKIQVENVRVNIDLTTVVNASMDAEAVEVSAMVVSAERPLVVKDMTSSMSTVTSEQIKNLPVDNVQQVLRLNAGIVMTAGQISIRGGRTGEVAYWVNGIAATDVYNGTPGLSVENSSIQELQVVSGTFNAEYGQAMSGIVNIVTKDGSDNYSGQIKVYGGSYYSTNSAFSLYKNLTTEANPVKNIYNINTTKVVSSERDFPLKRISPIYSGEFTLGGPVPLTGNSVKFFTNGRYYSNDGYFYGSNWFLPNGTPGDKSIVPMNPYRNTSLQGKLSWFLGNMRFSYDLFWNSYTRDRNYYPFSSNDFPFNFSSHNYLYNPYGLPKAFGDASTHLLTISQNVSRSTFYELRVSRYKSQMKQYVFDNPTKANKYLVSVQADDTKNPPIAAETFDASTDAGQAKLQSLIQQGASYSYIPDPSGPVGYLQPNSNISSGGEYASPASASFNDLGMDPTNTQRSTAYWAMKFDLISQATSSQELKVGAEARLHTLTLDRFQVVPATDATGTVIEPFVPAVPDPSSIFRSKYERKPMEFSAYAQDKMEFNQIIVNLGLRFDYFDANTNLPSDPSDPSIYSPFKPEHTYAGWTAMPLGYSGGLNQWINDNLASNTFRTYTPEERRAFMQKKTTAKMAVSPRLGIAFPITDRGVIHFSYGHFFQIPQFQYLYSNADFKISSGTSSSAALFGNPDLKPQKTVMYEIGLQQQLTDNIGVDFTMFYRDVRDWVGTSSAPISTYQVGVNYAKFENKDYENVRGATLKFEKRMSNNFSFHVDYTFQVADATYSNPTDAFNAISNNSAPVIALVPTNWDQRHTINAQLIYSKSDWIVSLIGTYWSGQPYTPSFPSAEATGASAVTGLTTNSAYKPDQKSIDMSISKRIHLNQSMYIEAFMNIYNVLDQADVTSVYSDTGSPLYTTGTRPDRISYSADRVSTPEDFINQPSWYVAPRQIQVGLSLGF